MQFFAALVLVALAPLPPDLVWAGTQTMWGTAQIPLIGTITTRTDLRVLARVSRSPTGIALTQSTCDVHMEPIAGVRMWMLPTSVSRLPDVTITLNKGADDGLTGTWTTRWSKTDVDSDGFPGVSLQVEVPLCGGQIYLAADTQSVAPARFNGNELHGVVTAVLQKYILGASNACLRLAAAQSQETLHGVIHYRPVNPDLRCATVPENAWPARPGAPP